MIKKIDIKNNPFYYLMKYLLLLLIMSYQQRSVFSSDEEMDSYYDNFIGYNENVFTNIFESGLNEVSGDDLSGSGDVVSGSGDDLSGSGDDLSGSSDVVSGSGDVVSGSGENNTKNSSKTRNYYVIIVLASIVGIIIILAVGYKAYKAFDFTVNTIPQRSRPPSFNGTHNNKSYVTTMVERTSNPDKMYTFNGNTNVSQCTNV